MNITAVESCAIEQPVEKSLLTYQTPKMQKLESNNIAGGDINIAETDNGVLS